MKYKILHIPSGTYLYRKGSTYSGNLYLYSEIFNKECIVNKNEYSNSEYAIANITPGERVHAAILRKDEFFLRSYFSPFVFSSAEFEIEEIEESEDSG